jgi:hypothetical protein
MSAAGPGTHDGCGGTLQRLVSTPITKVGERAAPSGSTDSMLRFRENQKIAAEKKR